MNLTSNAKTVVAKGAVVAGAADITDALVIDMLGFEAARFIYVFGALTAGTILSVAVAGKLTNTPTPGTDDLAGSGVIVPDTQSGNAVVVDVIKPTHRFLRPFVKRATQNAVLNCIIVELYVAREKPTAKDATVFAQKIVLSPANGVA
jgi:hypothetical protein